MQLAFSFPVDMQFLEFGQSSNLKLDTQSSFFFLPLVFQEEFLLFKQEYWEKQLSYRLLGESM